MLTKLILPEYLPSSKREDYSNFNCYLSLLEQKNLPLALEKEINSRVKDINEFLGAEPQMKDKLYRGVRTILKLVEKETGLVPQGYYQYTQMLSGLVYFGLPIGLAWAIALKNYAFLPLGLPIGLAIGYYLGYRKDNKAQNENRQLAIKLNLN